MCDTIVALGSVTADGMTLFGKNSDREPNKAHHIVRIPAARGAGLIGKREWNAKRVETRE
jgi:secernin